MNNLKRHHNLIFGETDLNCFELEKIITINKVILKRKELFKN
jgi:hypothetical protein